MKWALSNTINARLLAPARVAARNWRGTLSVELMANSTMTNGAVAQQVQKVEGSTLQVKYEDGEKTIVVPRNPEVVNRDGITPPM
jgi:hypothetical protein